jgi:hypothetical protein
MHAEATRIYALRPFGRRKPQEAISLPTRIASTTWLAIRFTTSMPNFNVDGVKEALMLSLLSIFVHSIVLRLFLDPIYLD